MNLAVRALVNTALVVGAFLALGINANTQAAPEGGWVSHDPAQAEADLPQNVPTWTRQDAHDFPNCVKSTGQPALSFVVVTQSAHRMVMDLGGVKHRNVDTKDVADNVWIVGVCK